MPNILDIILSGQIPGPNLGPGGTAPFNPDAPIGGQRDEEDEAFNRTLRDFLKETPESLAQKRIDEYKERAFGIKPGQKPTKMQRLAMGLSELGKSADVMGQRVTGATDVGPYVPTEERLRARALEEFKAMSPRLSTAVNELKMQEMARKADEDRRARTALEMSKLEESKRKTNIAEGQKLADQAIKRFEAENKTKGIEAKAARDFAQAEALNATFGGNLFGAAAKATGLDPSDPDYPKKFEEKVLEFLDRQKQARETVSTSYGNQIVDAGVDPTDPTRRLFYNFPKTTTTMRGPARPLGDPLAALRQEAAPKTAPAGSPVTRPADTPKAPGKTESIPTPSASPQFWNQGMQPGALTPIGVTGIKGDPTPYHMRNNAINYANMLLSETVNQFKNKTAHRYMGPGLNWMKMPGTEGAITAGRFKRELPLVGEKQPYRDAEDKWQSLLTQARTAKVYGESGKQINNAEMETAKSYLPDIRFNADTNLSRAINFNLYMRAAYWKDMLKGELAKLGYNDADAQSKADLVDITDRLNATSAAILQAVKEGKTVDVNTLMDPNVLYGPIVEELKARGHLPQNLRSFAPRQFAEKITKPGQNKIKIVSIE